MNDRRAHLRFGFLIAGGVFVVDQASKWWIVETVMKPPRLIEVAPFFNLVMGWNRGVSFGLLSSHAEAAAWGLVALALAISAGLVYWLARVEKRFLALAIGLVIGGALGNVIDRIRYGAVADFLDFHAFGYHWPAFNAADTAISVGAALIVVDALFDDAKSPKSKTPENKKT